MCPRQWVIWRGSLSHPEKERARYRVAVTIPAIAAHSCKSQDCPIWCPSFFLFLADGGCCLQMSAAHLCVTEPPMTSQSSVLRAPGSCPHPHSVSVKAWDFIQCVVSRKRSTHCSLIGKWLSAVGEWICRVLLRQRIKSLTFNEHQLLFTLRAIVSQYLCASVSSC